MMSVLYLYTFYSSYQKHGAAAPGAWREPREPAVTSGERGLTETEKCSTLLLVLTFIGIWELQVRKARRPSVAIIHDTPAS